MAKLIFLIGLPAAGKSSYCESYKVLNPDVVIVSSDAIREEVFGDVNDQSHNQEVFNIVEKRCREALKANKEVILDATNLNRKRRINFIKVMPKCEVEAVVFAIPFEVCCERNENRERVVPMSAMERMYKSFQPPHYAEGIDKIKYIRLGDFDDVAYYCNIRKLNRNCKHDNFHHSLSCGRHCDAAYFEAGKILSLDDEIYLNKKERSDTMDAAGYHDMSKYKCKVFHDMKGNPTEDAHYYGHECVSAYDYLVCFPENSGEELTFVSNLIANHMVFYAGEGAVKNRRKLYGEKFWAALEVIHKADKAAH